VKPNFHGIIKGISYEIKHQLTHNLLSKTRHINQSLHKESIINHFTVLYILPHLCLLSIPHKDIIKCYESSQIYTWQILETQ
jgi:hypothetical protein